MTKYKCIWDVEMKRGGDLINQTAFFSGKKYELMYMDGNYYVLKNEQGTPHHIPPKYLKERFREATE